MKVASAGQWVNSASSATAGQHSSQPWMLALRRLFTTPAPARSSARPACARGFGGSAAQVRRSAKSEGGKPGPRGREKRELDSRVRGNERSGARLSLPTRSPILLQDPLRLGLSVFHRLL